jgi:hypothetical protein
MREFMLKHSLVLKDISHWAIFLATVFAFATTIADVSAKETMEIIMLHPELAENSMLVKVGYLPTFK